MSHFVQNGAVAESEVVKQLFKPDCAAFFSKVFVNPQALAVKLGFFMHRAHTVNRSHLVVDACGQHCLYRVVKRAEVVLLHKTRNAEHFVRENRLSIKHRDDLFNTLNTISFNNLSHNPLTAAVAPAERHKHALTLSAVIY